MMKLFEVKLLFVFLLFILYGCEQKPSIQNTKAKNYVRTASFITEHNEVKENLSGNLDLGAIPIYTPVTFALDEGEITDKQYQYEEGYYYALVTDKKTGKSRIFESFTFNTEYKTPLLPEVILPQHEVRIKFFIEKQNPFKVEVFHSSDNNPFLTANVNGTASPHHGPLHFSPQNPKYLVHDDGTSFFGIAHNLSYEGESAKQGIKPFEISKTLRRYLPQGKNNPVNFNNAHIVGDVLSKFKAEGGNFIQLYLEYNTFQIANTSLEEYKAEEDRMRALEAIFDFCYQNDIYIQLAVTDHNDVVEWYKTGFCRTASCDSIRGGHDPNPYKEYVDKHPLIVTGSLNGGKVNQYRFPATRMMYYIHPEVKKLQKNKFRYIIARFGHYPNLGAFSVFSEQETLGDDDARAFSGDINQLKLASDTSPYSVDPTDYNDLALYHYQEGKPNSRFWVPPSKPEGVIEYKRTKDIITEWVLEMADFIHKANPAYLVTVGGSLWVNDSLLYQNPKRLNYVSTHVYDRPPSRNSLFANNVLLRSAAAGKPFLRGEGGTQSGQSNADLTRTNIHNSLWASAFCGSFSTYMEWYWQQSTFNEVEWMFPEINKPREYYRPISAFFASEEMHKYDWVPLGPYYPNHISDWRAWDPHFPDEHYLNYLKDPKSNPHIFLIDEDFKKSLNWTYKTKTMQYYDPAPAIFGEPCADYPPEFFVFRCFNFDVHDVRVKGAYPKADQIKVSINGDFKHEKCMDVEAYALKSSERILGWVHHKESYWLNHEGFSQESRDPNSIICATPPDTKTDTKNRIFGLKGATIHIPVHVRGTYEVQWYSTLAVTQEGKPLPIGTPQQIKTDYNMLSLPLPELRVDNDWRNPSLPDPDYAFKIRKVNSGLLF